MPGGTPLKLGELFSGTENPFGESGIPYWMLLRFATSGPDSVTEKLPFEAQTEAAVSCAEARQLLHWPAARTDITIKMRVQATSNKRQRVVLARIGK